MASQSNDEQLDFTLEELLEEAQIYFNSNPGRDTLAPNVGVHLSCRDLLDHRPVSPSYLPRLYKRVTIRNRANAQAQKIVADMEIQPISAYEDFEYEHFIALTKRFGDVFVLKDLLAEDKLIEGLSGYYTKPWKFVAASLMSVGVVTEEGFREKIALVLEKRAKAAEMAA